MIDVTSRGGAEPLLRLPPQHLQALRLQGVVRSFPKNAVVITEGDRSDSLYIIIDGAVKVYLSDETGRELLLRSLGPGDHFGEVILDEQARSASVMTLEKSHLSIVSLACFKSFLRDHPDAAFDLIKSFAAHIRDLTRQVGDLALQDAYTRITRHMTELAIEDGGRSVLPTFVSQQYLSVRAACSPSMVSNIFKTLREGGYISTDEGEIVILNKLPLRW